MPDLRHGCVLQEDFSIVNWNTLNASFCVQAYAEAVRLFGAPEIMNTDEGSQFTPDVLVVAVAPSGAKLSMDGYCAWSDNMFIERFSQPVK